MTFAESLYALANRSDFADIFHWSDDGTKFWISDSGVFASLVLPAYYGHSSFTSFVRQLKVYGTLFHMPACAPP